MLQPSFDYQSCIHASERVSWKISEVLGERTFDFSRRFLPETLAGVDTLSFLSSNEKLKLNQIRGYSYLYLFRFVEEYIIAMAMQHAQAEIFGDETSLRALLRFAEEEVKHQQLFRQGAATFEKGFGTPCDVVGSPEEVADFILQKPPMAVLLITLHIELFTQQHYVDSIRNNEDLDPLFKSLLKHHWLEESQHARLDTLELAKLAREATTKACDKAVDDYLDIVKAFDGLLAAQVQSDIVSLERVTGRSLSDQEKAELVQAQHKAYRYTFLVSGMTNHTFIDRLGEFSAAGQLKVVNRVKDYV